MDALAWKNQRRNCRFERSTATADLFVFVPRVKMSEEEQSEPPADVENLPMNCEIRNFPGEFGAIVKKMAVGHILWTGNQALFIEIGFGIGGAVTEEEKVPERSIM
jgi:hypothetical protein